MIYVYVVAQNPYAELAAEDRSHHETHHHGHGPRLTDDLLHTKLHNTS